MGGLNDGAMHREDLVRRILFVMVASGYDDPNRTATTILTRWISNPRGVDESEVVEAVADFVRYLGGVDG